MKINGGVSAIVAAATLGSPAAAQLVTQHYTIAAQPLSEALTAVARISDREVVAPTELLEGKRSQRISGDYTPEQAFAALLVGTGLRVDLVDGAFIIRPERLPVAPGPLPPSPEIVVTGSRIRGAPVASPVINLDRETLRDSGITSLGEAVRSLPQNFGGGTNIGIGLNVPAENGANIGGGSSVNLRGLGSDATLTLLNGHRLPYGASRQSVDVSAVPLLAVERLEVVPDGASALYGSDAVAGVVNIILRRDFDGLEASARVGASTEDGNVQQLYGVIAGQRWNGGGAFAAYEFNRATPIIAEDRAYATTRSRGLTLFPGVRRHNVIASLHQRLSPSIEVSIDGLFNSRRSGFSYALNAAGDFSVSRGFQKTLATSYSVAPRLDITLGGDWQAHALATYGRDQVDYEAAVVFGPTTSSASQGCYCNTGFSAELSGDGTLLRLNGAPVKLAIGAGYRGNRYESFRGIGNVQNIDRRQDITFGYGELNVPVIAPGGGSAFGYRLNVTGAVRYERYADIGGVATPKLGIIYGPNRSFDIKATWGRSFRAPTFLQQFAFQQGVALPVTRFGGSGFPTTATGLLLVGGNPDLKPERAQSLSATLTWHPQSIDHLRLEVSYFATRYIDRIVNPVTLTAQALSNPTFQDYVTRMPSRAQVEAAVASADLFTNSTGTTFDPARVVAIVNSLNVNAGRQSIHGVDVLADYRFALGSGELGTQVNASYLASERQLTPRTVVQRLAGTIFNPPHLRARASLSWRTAPLTVATTISYIGGVDDARFTRVARIGGMTTIDLTGRYRVDRKGLLSGTEFTVAALNMLDVPPASIATTTFTDTPYDSTNYSPVGRYLSFGVTKRW